jgi:hypothetical protein
MGFDFDVFIVCSAEVPQFGRRESTRYLEAKITQLHKHLSTQIQCGDNDDDATAVTMVTPTVCSNDYSWRTGGSSMSTISTFSYGSHATSRSLTTIQSSSRLNLTNNNTAPDHRDDWGYFVDVNPVASNKPNRRSYRGFLHREIAATVSKTQF